MILARVNILIFVCTVCYALRLVALGILFSDLVFDTKETDRVPAVGWFFISQWAPTLIPVIYVHIYTCTIYYGWIELYLLSIICQCYFPS